MTDVNKPAQSTPTEPSENRDEAVDTETKMTPLDKMIEEFKLSSPVKNKRKIYKGVF